MERYQNESKRLLAVLEKRFADGRQWIMGDEYTIADIAIFPWLRGAKHFYKADKELGMEDIPQTMAWLERCIARPASQKGLAIPSSEPNRTLTRVSLIIQTGSTDCSVFTLLTTAWIQFFFAMVPSER